MDWLTGFLLWPHCRSYSTMSFFRPRSSDRARVQIINRDGRSVCTQHLVAAEQSARRNEVEWLSHLPSRTAVSSEGLALIHHQFQHFHVAGCVFFFFLFFFTHESFFFLSLPCLWSTLKLNHLFANGHFKWSIIVNNKPSKHLFRDQTRCFNVLFKLFNWNSKLCVHLDRLFSPRGRSGSNWKVSEIPFVGDGDASQKWVGSRGKWAKIIRL